MEAVAFKSRRPDSTNLRPGRQFGGQIPRNPGQRNGQNARVQKHNPGLRSEEHTSELQSRPHLLCRLLLEKKTLLGAVVSSSSGKQGAAAQAPTPAPSASTPQRALIDSYCLGSHHQRAKISGRALGTNYLS